MLMVHRRRLVVHHYYILKAKDLRVVVEPVAEQERLVFVEREDFDERFPRLRPV